MNEQPPVLKQERVIDTKPMGDVSEIAKEGMPVAETLATLPKDNSENKEEEINEIVSLFDKRAEEARKASTVKQNIFRTLKTAFLGNSNIANFFNNETKNQIRAWSNNPSVEKFTKTDMERILAQAKVEDFEGRLGTKTSASGKMEICYVPKKNAGWSVDKTKVME